MPLNLDAIGKSYHSKPFRVIRRDAIYFALAYNDPHPTYLDRRRPEGLIVPPMYAVVYAHGPVECLIKDTTVGLSYTHLVHYAQTLRWFAPVRPGDEISSRGTISDIDMRENGAVIRFDVSAANQRGDTVVAGTWAFFDKSAGQVGAGRPPKPASPSGTPYWTQALTIPAYQTFVYAEASGDHNPIHLNDDAAVAAGLPGIILHGLCTMAHAHRTIVKNAPESTGDPHQVAALHAGFSRPVRPRETITFQSFVSKNETNHLKFNLSARNSTGRDVLREAWFELRAPSESSPQTDQR